MPSGQRRTKKTAETPVITVDDSAVAPPATVKPKKAKKPVNVIAVVTPNGIQGTFQTENRRPLIAHLAVNSNDFVFEERKETVEPMRRMRVCSR